MSYSYPALRFRFHNYQYHFVLLWITFYVGGYYGYIHRRWQHFNRTRGFRPVEQHEQVPFFRRQLHGVLFMVFHGLAEDPPARTLIQEQKVTASVLKRPRSPPCTPGIPGTVVVFCLRVCCDIRTLWEWRGLSIFANFLTGISLRPAQITRRDWCDTECIVYNKRIRSVGSIRMYCTPSPFPPHDWFELLPELHEVSGFGGPSFTPSAATSRCGACAHRDTKRTQGNVQVRTIRLQTVLDGTLVHSHWAVPIELVRT